jgi:glycosyltransferase involved in cell wall biosynthesis
MNFYNHLKNKTNTNRKNLIFLLPNFSIGGGGNSILNLCKNINYKNYNISIISIGKNSYKKKFLNLSAKVIELKKNKLIYSIFKIKKIIIKNTKQNKTYLISNINYANVISCIFFNSIKNLKLILIERTPIQELQFYNSFCDYIKKKIIKICMRFFYRRADYIIGNSSNVCKDINKYCKVKSYKILPYINFNKKNKVKRINSTANVTWIGRNTEEKNIDDFLYSLKYLNYKKIKINIISNIKIDFLKYHIPKEIIKKIFIKKIKISKISNIYKKSHILISTSLYEGFPNVVAEAINYKCLIIASNSYGGINDLIKNNSYGVIYNVKDPENLADKINIAINSYKLQKNKIIKANKNLENLAKNYNNKYLIFFNKITNDN